MEYYCAGNRISSFLVLWMDFFPQFSVPEKLRQLVFGGVIVLAFWCTANTCAEVHRTILELEI